uniref:UPAR/Ly6 domain-containing protein n=1 Tax=Sphenodon punctatus TaxID=8508 RepID=A0A8D0GYU4_SPHPU
MKLALLAPLAALLLILPSGDPLRCYTCLFPTISPLDCLSFVTPCGPGQSCMTSIMTGHRGALQLVIYEKSCGGPSLCWTHGIRWVLGANFTYSTSCCSTDLCNGAREGLSTGLWAVLATALLISLLQLH